MARISRSYGIDSPLTGVFPQPVVASRAPTSADKNYPIGQSWIDKLNNQVYVFTSIAAGSATWALSSPGASDVDTLTGDSGGALSPTAGNITLAGGTNITSVGSGSTITFNLDAAIVLATSVSAPLYTVAAATDLAITSATGQDIIIKMGDAAGTNKVSFTDSADVEVFAIDSNGGLTFTTLTVTAAFTQSGGAASINASSNFNTAINTGTSTGTVTIGNTLSGAIAISGGASVTVDAVAGISIDAATASNLTVTGASEDLTLSAVGGSIGISSSEAVSDAIIINASDGAGGIQVQAGTGGILVGNQADCTTLSIGDIAPTAARTITVGGGTVVTAAVTDTIDIAPDGATTNADSVKTVNINTGTVAVGQLLTNIASGGITSGTHTTSIASGAITAGTVTLNALSGNVTAGTVTMNTMTGTGTKIYNLGNADAGTTVNIDAAVLIADSVNADTKINTGTSTGAFTLGNSLAGNIAVATGGTVIADAAGNIEVNSSAGQILIGNDAVSQNISIGTAGTREVTIGSTTTTSGLTLQAGTGNITATGTFEAVDAKVVRATGIEYTLKSSPTTCTAANTGGVATGAGGDINMLGFPEFNMEQFIIGTQTIIKPVMDTSGLLCSLDLTNTDGVEYNFGAARTLSEYAFTIGTSAAFFFEVTMTIADITGGNPYIIGFRKSEANNATYSNYTDYYALGMISGTSAVNLTLTSELNAGGQTLQDSGTAWTGGAGGTVTMKVLVSAAGVVTATIDGGAPSTPLAYTFDSTDVVCPYIHLVHNANAGAVHITKLAVGFQ